MTTSRWTALGVVIACVVLGLWFWSRRSEIGNEISLVAQLASAEKRTNVEGPGQFAVEPVTIDWVARQAIRAHQRGKGAGAGQS